MVKSFRPTLLATLASAAVFASTGSLLADERVCRGTIGAVTVDNVRVPQEATCRLNGTRVKGTVTVKRRAVLIART
jgi:hypothetical protein